MTSSLGRELADEENEPEVYAVDAPPPLEVLPDSLRRLVRSARPGVLEAGVGSGPRLLIVVAPAPSAPPGAGPAFLPAGPPRSAALELHDELCEPRGGSRRRAAFAWASALALREALVALEPRPDDVAELILHAATRAGTTASLEALLGAGASPDARDDGGRTPLHLAAQANLADRVQLLLAAGASPDARDDAGRTALHLACGVAGASTEVLSALLDAGADVEARDSDGRTPVLVALVAADRLAVELLARGARADAVAADGSTALHVAAGSGRVREVLGHIVQSGAAPGARDAAGRTALVLALERGNHAIVPVLLRLGVPVDDRARAAAVFAGVSLPTPEAPSAGTAEPRPACRHGSPYDPTTGAYSCGWC
jgi:ankyrin repeat protein